MGFMPEALPHELPPAEIINYGLQLLLDEIHFQAKHPPDGDENIAALSQAIYSRQQANSDFHNILLDFSIQRQIHNEENGTGPSDACGILRTTITNFMMRQEDDLSDKRYKQAAGYEATLDAFEQSLLGKDALDTEFTMIVSDLLNNVQTTIDDRYVTLELMTQLYAERVDPQEGLVCCDIGPGLMHGNQRMMRKDIYPFTAPEVVSESEQASRQLSRKVGSLIRRPGQVSQFICVDSDNVYDTERRQFNANTVNWVTASVRQSERDDPVFMSRFNNQLEELHPAITFVRADLTQPQEQVKFRDRINGQKIGFVSLITMSHQQSKEDRLTQFNVAQSLVAPGGILFIQDFLYLRGNKLRGLYPYKNWHDPFRYCTYIDDSLSPGVEPICQAKSSRVKHIALGSGHMLLGGRLQTVPEAILTA